MKYAVRCLGVLLAVALILGGPGHVVAQEAEGETTDTTREKVVENEGEDESENEGEDESENEKESEASDDVIVVVPEDEPTETSDETSDESEGDETTVAVPEEEPETDAMRVDTVEVTAEDLSTVGGAATKLDEEELQRQEYDDPHALLLQVPGVYVRPEDGFGLRPNIGMRGANSERSKKVTLMEDDVLLAPAPYSAPAAYYFPIVSRMVGLEVYKGPGSIKYGPNTIGGAINWLTRDVPADEITGGVDVNLGSYFTGKAHSYFGIGSDWGGFMIEGVHWQSDGFKELDGGGDTGFDRQEFMAKGRLNTDLSADVSHLVELKLGYSREVSNETYVGLTDEDFEDNPDRRYPATQLDRLDWDRTQATLSYRLNVGDFDLDTTLYRHDFQRSWRKLNGFEDETPLEEILADPDAGRRAVLYDVLTGEQDTTVEGETLVLGTNAREYVSQGLQTRANYRFSGDAWYNKVEAGARVHRDEITRDHTTDGFLMEDGELVADDAPTEETTQNHGKALALATYVLDEFFIWNLTLTPGLRAEFIDTELENLQTGDETDNFQTVFIPGIGAHYAITDQFGAVAGIHRGFSPVSPGQPEEVEPETSINYETGVRFSDYRTGSLFELIGFFNDYGNLIGECSFSVGCTEQQLDRQFNAGEVWIFGAEAVAKHTFALGAGWYVPGRLAYTFTRTRFQTSFVSDNPQFGDVEEGDELPYVPQHQGSLQLGVTDQSFTFNGRVTYVGEMREEASSGEEGRKTERYALLDVLASYRFLGNFTIYGKVDNILNTQPVASRRPFGARPIKPLMARLGLKYEY